MLKYRDNFDQPLLMQKAMLPGILKTNRILPAIRINEIEDALPLAEALLKGGLKIMEITLRTPVAIEAVKQISKYFPEMHLGTGTIMNINQVKEAIDAGAQFGLAAALNEDIVKYCSQQNFPFIPGVSTPSEIEKAYTLGSAVLKVFPIQQLGGPAYLQAMNGPYGHLDLQYIPMGGVKPDNMKSYLSVPNVIAVGGSWFADDTIVKRKDWNGITRMVLEAYL
jgi:2-dehydro-3-deoxyphosphogluconate aldolase/(4S)-4-hydroxy-2-oxoglutarate aldolase